MFFEFLVPFGGGLCLIWCVGSTLSGWLSARSWLFIHALREELYAHPGEPSPRMRRLYDRLTARYPCITVDSNGPWSDGPLIANFGAKMAILGLSFSRVGEVLPFVIQTATSMGLTVLDAQDEKIHRPGRRAPPARPATASASESTTADRGLRPAGIVVANAIVLLLGAVMVLWQRDQIGHGTGSARLIALCFMVAGLSAVVAGVAVWLRARWARVPLALWIGAMVAGFLVFGRMDAGLLMALTFVGGPQIGIAWYLDGWLQRGAPSEPSALAASDRAIATPLLILLAVGGPPIIGAVAMFGFAAVGGEAGMIAYVLLVPAQLAFIVALSRRSASVAARAIFVAIAVVSSLISTLVVLIGSSVK